ncbi:WGxxGxxG family protein [Micrococcus luteus]|uniref:WGxxGxxG family protein n=1 Tax=Micrococcus luteus TaxID=1270 RepID=UPI0008592769|nr:WGxxGxxG family protein [Micrococcus luteus]MCV7619671.1 LPXTG cell wall anchor domain-containing protein [Micrococcus luteus]MCV7742377.1 LPXTG cell wall anchor domain-containing protein [Micrococcus luteus]QHG60654.1 LPXTG cell wall anchor domain-containing protein [Micrococcus luteus]
MTDIRRTATALTLGAAVVTGLGAPAAVAQTTAPATETATTAPASESPAPQEEEKDDNGNWGLWGLAGLLGLAGLAGRRKREVHAEPVRRDHHVGGAHRDHDVHRVDDRAGDVRAEGADTRRPGTGDAR